MYKIVSTNIETGAVLEREFKTVEDAKIYRQYHLRFGEWATGTYWTEEKNVTAELRPFVVDEMTDVGPKGIIRQYQVCCKWKIKEEVATDNEILAAWILFRRDRNTLLRASDWTQVSDVPMSTADRGEWKRYRQYLRDVTKLHTDATIAGAKIASLEEWREGAR
jgi:hypothetical protein